MTKLTCSTPKAGFRPRGFTLAEMAVVVVIAGILVTMGLKMTLANLTNAAYSSTISKQAQIKTALISYLRTNGSLPCPDLKVPPDGKSSLCTANFGVVPWTALQISKDTVIDGWGNFFSYQVANGGNSVKNWTVKTAVATTFDIGQLASPAAALTVNQGDGVGALTLLTNKAVVVLVSAGMNGFGAKTVQGIPGAAPPAANTDETTNATTATVTFVIRPVTTNPAALGGPYDDIVTYLLPQDLLQPLVTEQTIASCKTYCTTACTAAGFAGAGNPTPYCTGPALPVSSATATSCIGPGNPYPTCVSANNPAMCTVSATTPIPIGNPKPSCP